MTKPARPDHLHTTQGSTRAPEALRYRTSSSFQARGPHTKTVQSTANAFAGGPRRSRRQEAAGRPRCFSRSRSDRLKQAFPRKDDGDPSRQDGGAYEGLRLLGAGRKDCGPSPQPERRRASEARSGRRTIDHGGMEPPRTLENPPSAQPGHGRRTQHGRRIRARTPLGARFARPQAPGRAAPDTKRATTALRPHSPANLEDRGGRKPPVVRAVFAVAERPPKTSLSS